MAAQTAAVLPKEQRTATTSTAATPRRWPLWEPQLLERPSGLPFDRACSQLAGFRRDRFGGSAGRSLCSVRRVARDTILWCSVWPNHLQKVELGRDLKQRTGIIDSVPSLARLSMLMSNYLAQK
jgi:hypothetical protein